MRHSSENTGNRSKNTALILYAILNLFLLIFAPSIIFDEKTNANSFALVFVLFSAIILSIRWQLINHLYYFVFFLFVYISIYFIQTAIGVRFLTGGTDVGVVSPIVLIYFVVHTTALLFSGRLATRSKKKNSDFISNRSVFIYSFSAVMFAIFVILITGPSAFFSSREEQYLSESQVGFAKLLVFMAKIIPYFVLITIFQKIAQVKNRIVYYILFLFVLLFSLAISNPINTPRYISMTSIFIFFVFIISTFGRIRILPVMVLSSPLIFLLALPISSLSRHGLSLLGIAEIGMSYTSLEFSSFQVLLDAFDVRNKLISSLYTLSAIFIFIPRSVWTSKTEGFGDEIASISGYTFTNTGVTTSFNSFVDYGWIGLVLYSLVIGFFMKKATLLDFMSFRDRSAFYAVLFFSMIPMLVRGDFSTYMFAFYAFTISYEFGRIISIQK